VQVAQVIRQVAALEALRAALQADRRDEALEGDQETSIGDTAVDLAREPQRMIATTRPGKKAATRRASTRAALLAARDWDEEDVQEEDTSEDESRDKAEE